MLYVERNSEGQIVAVSLQSKKTDAEPKAVMDEEILKFLAKNSDSDFWMKMLSASDMGIIRILEDLIDLLVAKNIIMYTELPEDAQKKIQQRKKAREKMGVESFMVDDII